MPIEDGGQNLLDILTRNEAITVTWVKLYLDLAPNHPIWAAAADAIIAHHTPVAEENVDFMQRTNIFLQTWKTSTTRLPDDLKALLKAVQKYNVCLDSLALSRDIL